MLPNMNATASAAIDSVGTIVVETAKQWLVAATACIACVAAFLLQTVFKHDPFADIPIVGTEYGGSESRRREFMNGGAKSLYLNGYKKVRLFYRLLIPLVWR